MRPKRRLQVAGGGRSGGRPRDVFRKRRPAPPSRRILDALLLMAAGVGLLVLLLQVPRLVDLDSLLLVSSAIAHLIGGLSEFLLGLLQLLAVLLLVAVALLALVLLLGGVVRLVRALFAAKPGAARPLGKPAGRS